MKNIKKNIAEDKIKITGRDITEDILRNKLILNHLQLINTTDLF